MKKKSAALVTAGVITVAAAGGAYAYWTTTGSGSGQATTGTTAAVTVNQTSANGVLYPGSSAALSGTFDNPASYPQFIHSVTATVVPFSVAADAGKPACTDADFAILGTATVDQDLAAGPGVGSWSGLSIKLLNTAANQDNCKSLSASQLKIAYVANAS